MKKGVWTIGFAISLAIMLAAAGCGSAGGAASTASSQTNATGVELATVQVTIPLPSGSKNKAKGDAQPRRILAASLSFNVSVTGAGIATPITGTANKAVTGATTITLQVPVGTARTFTAKAFDAANATGNEISYGTATSDVVAGVNTVNMTLNVIPRAIASPVSAVTTAGTATTLAFTANDADAAAISNTPTTLINWTVVGGAANGTIDTSGVYTPPATYPGASGTVSQSVTVQTVSAVDATTPAITATLTLNNPNGQVNVVFASTLFSDDFSSGNYSNWYLNPSSGAVFSVISGELQQTNTAPNVQYHALTYPGGYTWSNYILELDTRHVSGFYSITALNIYFRVQQGQYSPNNCPVGYALQLQPPGAAQYSGLYNYSASGATLLQNLTPDISYPNYIGYHVKVQVQGSTIQAWIDGVQVINFVDVTYSTGSIGLATIHVVGGFDNVVVTGL